MKIQEQMGKILNGVKYVKYVLVIPPNIVQALGWRKGDALTGIIHKDALILTRSAEEKKTKGGKRR